MPVLKQPVQGVPPMPRSFLIQTGDEANERRRVEPPGARPTASPNVSSGRTAGPGKIAGSFIAAAADDDPISMPYPAPRPPLAPASCSRLLLRAPLFANNRAFLPDALVAELVDAPP